MEAMNLVEVVLNQGNEEENDRTSTLAPYIGQSSPIKGLDESVTITVTRTPGRSGIQRGGKPANFAMLSSPLPTRNGRYGFSLSPREEMVCNGCERVFKYKAAFLRHEAQCGLPAAVKLERAAIIEAQKAEKAAEVERQKILESERQKVVELERHKMEEKQQKLPELRCPICFKQFNGNDSFKDHDFNACAEERKNYTFICRVCKAKFKYKNHLRRHEDSHNNVRRYNCEVCTTAFLRPDHLKRHMMRMHGIVSLPAQNAPEKRSPVPRAVLSTVVKSALSTTKNAPMQCPQCSKVLSRRDHLLRHLRNVHHVNYEPRGKSGRRSADTLQGFDGVIKQETYDSYQDDEDGSENLSMTSHDGLMIDESFESVKMERESPTPLDDDDESSKQFFNESQPQDSSVKLGSYNHFVEAVPVKSEVRATNGNDADQPMKGDKNVPSHISSCYGQGTKSHMESEKPGNSDSNQNVLANGHAARSAGDDWISDLANYSGW